MKKEKLINLDLARLHNAEFKQFLVRFFEDFGKTDLKLETDADFKVLFEKLKGKIPSYEKGLERIRSSEETKKLAELDHARDTDMRALRLSIRPYKYAKTDDKKKAFETLKRLIDPYKDVSKKTYEEETSNLTTLITQLKAEPYVNAVKTLQIKEFVSELEKSNKAFDELFSHRSFQTLQKEAYHIRPLRKELSDDYRNMVNYIVTLSGVKQDEFYKKTLEVINNSRKYYADVIARRKPNAPSAKNKENTNVIA